MNLKVNIKKLSPTLSIGAAAATAVPSVIAYCQIKGQPVVINNFVGDIEKEKLTPSPATTTITTNKSVRYKRAVNMRPLPSLNNLKDKQTLGEVWKPYLLHDAKFELWQEKERELISSPIGGSPSHYSIKSQLFSNARKVILKNKKVTGRVLYSICKWSYEIKEWSSKTEHVIRDVWNYCKSASSKPKKKVNYGRFIQTSTNSFFI